MLVTVQSSRRNGPMSRLDSETLRALEPLLLSPRLIDVLALLLQGRSNKVIARELHLSTDTVKEYVATILRRLDLHSRTQVPMSVRSYHETLLAWDSDRRSNGQPLIRTGRLERRNPANPRTWTGEERRRIRNCLQQG